MLLSRMLCILGFALCVGWASTDCAAQATGASEPATPSADIRRASGDEPLLMSILHRKGRFAAAIVESDRTGARIAELLAFTLALSGAYGLAMGISRGPRQALASCVKVPALFLLTLAVCFPFLFVASALAGSALGAGQTLALLLFALALNSVLLASCAPIVGFFGLGSNDHFMKLLHVATLAACGAVSMAALSQGVATLAERGALLPQGAPMLFRIWALIYGFVGAQMAWTLRPFIGSSGLPFELIRRSKTGLNFYTAVWTSWVSLRSAARADTRLDEAEAPAESGEMSETEDAPPCA